MKELAHEGNVRRSIIKDAQGKTLIEVPLTVGVVGAPVAPVDGAMTAVRSPVNDRSTLPTRVRHQRHPIADVNQGENRRLEAGERLHIEEGMTVSAWAEASQRQPSRAPVHATPEEEGRLAGSCLRQPDRCCAS